eukprot:5018705-Pyramimonas_sp.AAC.2
MPVHLRNERLSRPWHISRTPMKSTATSKPVHLEVGHTGGSVAATAATKSVVNFATQSARDMQQPSQWCSTQALGAKLMALPADMPLPRPQRHEGLMGPPTENATVTQASPPSVSYTHLRAHETGAYL